MNFTKQLIRGPKGDCFRACVCTLLKLPPDSVPNFASDYPPDAWFGEFRTWLANHYELGCLIIRDNESMALDAMRGRPAILGYGKKDEWHAVIWKNGKVIWDPATGIRNPKQDHYENCDWKEWYIFTILTPYNAVKHS